MGRDEMTDDTTMPYPAWLAMMHADGWQQRTQLRVEDGHIARVTLWQHRTVTKGGELVVIDNETAEASRAVGLTPSPF